MVAIARFFPILLVALIALGSPAPANAQILSSKPHPYASLFLPPGAEVVPTRSLLEASKGQALSEVLKNTDSTAATSPAQQLPRGLLPTMYVGLATLQTLDAHSTFRAMDAGLVEQNPLMRWATSHPAAFVSVKAAATAGTIYVAETIRKKHPKRALAFMAAINAAYAVVVLHNYKQGSPAH